MTGEKKRDDDSDFLDDDFIVEDIAGKGEDLDNLFDMPGKPKKAPSGGSPAGADEEDVLFTDHTKGLDPSFEGTPQFAESGGSTWSGEGLDLEPNARLKPKKDEGQESEEPEAQDEEFELDSDEQLEVVGAPEASDGIEQFENSGPFTVDETQAGQSANEEPAQPGWEPLPATDMDALHEGPELARVERSSYEDAEGELVGAGVGADGEEDVVADAEKVDRAAIRPIGPVRWETKRRGRLVASAAVLLFLVGGGAVVVFRPELVGLHLEPARVEQAKVLRPNVAIEVAVPRLPVSSDPGTKVPTPPVTPVAGDPPKPPPVVPVAVDPPKPAPVVPVAGDPQKPPTPTNPVVPVVVVGPQPESGPWPVPVRQGAPGSHQPGLIRVSDDLKIGEHTFVPPPSAKGVEGVLPGSKAFAQLHNGNYFIGGVKTADAKSVTLRLEDGGGEITLQLDAIARLTELGSSDYAELQKVTTGFVRLTNNNRLVGGILSQIADDHVVLEFRKNRVMVPRSAIGAVVQGDDDLTVRLDTTREEDDWLRRLAERELGTGQPMMPPSPTNQKPALSAPPRPPR
ncbi:MAG TPA: hypothetical protein VFD82_04245 [Planctomycetota bacterium]|nr:hypothetical protein [Planctomycetota bacterium]